jgi:formamidopyrimidine-DNA glycosylase
VYTRRMPELPEVETVVRELRRKLPGATITSAVVTAPDMYRRDSRDVSCLQGARVAAVERLGKAIVVHCESARGAIDMAVHLGMTGQLLWSARRADASALHQHARWELADGAELRLIDPRRFGFVFVEAPDKVRSSLAMGPDALDIGPDELALALRGRRAAVKALLLHQSIVAGLGNIYVDELLFLARVHPLTTGNRAAARAKAIVSAARRVLAQAIRARGTTLRDYRRPDGSRGEFQVRLRVYGREGSPCVRCRARIQKIVVGQRGTHFCPRCQRAPRGTRTSSRK